MKRYVVAIDWKDSSVCSLYSYVELSAKTIKDALIEAPAVAARYCKKNMNLGWNLNEVWGLRILTQTEAQKGLMDAEATAFRYNPVMHTWFEEELDYPFWSNVCVCKVNL